MGKLIKDAPCLCKGDDMEQMQPKRNFFQRLLYKRLRRKNKRYPYPILYSDGTISKAQCDRIGRKPLGVVFENHLITLHDSPKKMGWRRAMDYCKNVKAFGQSCEAGTIEFWKKCIIEEESYFINKTLFSLGGETIKPWREYWSSSECSDYRAWVFCMDTDVIDSGEKCNFKHWIAIDYVVRPVLDFSKLSPEIAARFVWLT